MKKFGEEENLPHPAFSSYLVAKERDDWAYAVKPIYNQPKTTTKAGKKYVDHNKPARAYIKLNTRGKGEDIECFTPIYGPGDKPLSPWKCMGIFGHCQLVVKWDGIFWGSHGKNSHGASIPLRVSEMSFTPDVVKRGVDRKSVV